MTGAAARITAEFTIGARCATKSSRKSYHRSKVAESSESMWAQLVKVNHFLVVPVKCETSCGQCPPVCSSSHWQAMKTGTLILLTKVSGSKGFATAGL